MCNIAGYAGEKRAAPILIEMIRKQQFFDGGLSTGIATISDGKLYTAKVLGNVDDLIKKTNALNFPGTVGIIHSRPDDDFLVNAHPFLAEENKTALVENGVFLKEENLVKKRDDIVKMLLEAGIEFPSAKITERPGGNPVLPDGRCISYDDSYIGYVEYLRKNGTEDYMDAMTKASTDLFSDSVYLLVTENVPDSIFVSRMTRPMNIMKKEDGCYLATSQLAFSDWEQAEYIKSLPEMKTVKVTKDGFEESKKDIKGATVVDFSEEEYKEIREQIREKLKKAPVALDGLGGGIYVKNSSLERVRPNVKASYDALWEFEKEGILKRYDKESEFSWMPGKKVMKTFFYI